MRWEAAARGDRARWQLLDGHFSGDGSRIYYLERKLPQVDVALAGGELVAVCDAVVHHASGGDGCWGAGEVWV
ncbi:hypothetical protein SMJ63A_60183 [Stenotrophomonas geniculata]